MRNFLWVILLSMVPVIELRGAIPLGCSLGMPAWQVFAAALIGNMLPVPFVILFIRKIFDYFRKHCPWLNSILDKIEARAEKKLDTVRRFEVFGLCLFVAIPLPGTGAWTGALIAALLDIRLKRAVPTILLGVLIAGVVVSILSYGVKLGVGSIR